jgi:hypothetical protein
MKEAPPATSGMTRLDMLKFEDLEVGLFGLFKVESEKGTYPLLLHRDPEE